MKIKHIKIENFRLLRNVTIGLEEQTTLIVGRNNSGKTSIAEFFRRLIGDRTPSFKLEDFSLGSHDQFWTAFEAFRANEDAPDVVALLPRISATIDIEYDVDAPDLGALSECILDLDPNCNQARLLLTYQPVPTAAETLFSELPLADDDAANRLTLFGTLGSRLRSGYTASLEAVDPGDATNRKPLESNVLTALISGGFINAQRGLDDDTHRERDVLGKVVEVLFQSALADPVDPERRSTAEQLTVAVEKIQADLHEDFNKKLTSLLPTFDLFGYPGLSDPNLVTETSFDIDKLLNDHTKVRYAGANGITLPETYSGLGVRNLVYMLLQLLRFFREYQASPVPPGVHLVFIEEPEAHLHPQMQEVFIRQLDQITEAFVAELNEKRPWPVQFVVTTHSPHMANEARFEAMRYFLSAPDGEGIRQAVVKDLRKGMDDTSESDREFLHQYLTLTRCDLFFADKVVLIEGTSERILLPEMIRKIDNAESGMSTLGSQYLSVMEVGGAYAHQFFDLLEFLELRTLIITDIDTVTPNDKNKRVAVPVSKGTFTSNGCIKSLFGKDVSPTELLEKSEADKITGIRRIAFQTPEAPGGPCGRSFEDAFILANPELFQLGGDDPELAAYEMADDQKKSTFALKHAIEQTNWKVPKYISEGLLWLAELDATQTKQTLTAVAEPALDPDDEIENDAEGESDAE